MGLWDDAMHFWTREWSAQWNWVETRGVLLRCVLLAAITGGLLGFPLSVIATGMSGRGENHKLLPVRPPRIVLGCAALGGCSYAMYYAVRRALDHRRRLSHAMCELAAVVVACGAVACAIALVDSRQLEWDRVDRAVINILCTSVALGFTHVAVLVLGGSHGDRKRAMSRWAVLVLVTKWSIEPDRE
jgi:hypothetical protein